MQIANDAIAQQLYQKRMNDFIEARTKIESEVNAFLRSLEVDDVEFRERCNVQEGLTARDVLPSLWAEEFDEATYQSELAKLNNYIASVRAISDQLNAEALACLQEQ